MAEEVDYYKAMKLPRTAFESDIKKAFRAYALRWHPDRAHPEPGQQGRFEELCAAYEVLSDEKLRSAFDRYGPKGLGWEKWSPSQPNRVFNQFFEQHGGAGVVRDYLRRPKPPQGTKPADWDETFGELTERYPIEGLGSNSTVIDPWAGITSVPDQSAPPQQGLGSITGMNKDKMMDQWRSRMQPSAQQETQQTVHALSNTFKDSLSSQMGNTVFSAKDSYLRSGRKEAGSSPSSSAFSPGMDRINSSHPTRLSWSPNDTLGGFASPNRPTRPPETPPSQRGSSGRMPGSTQFTSPRPPSGEKDLRTLMSHTLSPIGPSGPASVKESMMKNWHSTGRGPAALPEAPNVRELNESFKSSIMGGSSPGSTYSMMDSGRGAVSPRTNAAGSLAYTRRAQARAGGSTGSPGYSLDLD